MIAVAIIVLVTVLCLVVSVPDIVKSSRALIEQERERKRKKK